MCRLTKWTLGLVLFMCVSGCVPAILAVVGASAGGAIIYDKRTADVILQDRAITDSALAQLNQDKDLTGQARIEITTFNHVVLMVGQARTRALSRRAYQDVSKVRDIKHIYNQVEISDLLTLTDRSADTWITSQVKTVMLATKGLSSTQIKVVTENKVVYLMGLVNTNQAQLATDAARKVHGVQKVVQVFEYES